MNVCHGGLTRGNESQFLVWNFEYRFHKRQSDFECQNRRLTADFCTNFAGFSSQFEAPFQLQKEMMETKELKQYARHAALGVRDCVRPNGSGISHRGMGTEGKRAKCDAADCGICFAAFPLIGDLLVGSDAGHQQGSQAVVVQLGIER
jgi:hypothetical protein